MTKEQELLIRYQENKVLQFKLIIAQDHFFELEDIFTEIYWMLEMPRSPLEFLVGAQDIRIRSKMEKIIFGERI